MIDATRVIRAVFAVAFLTGVTGCASMRLHDAGRNATAQNARDESTQLLATAPASFDAMEANLAAVAEAHDRITALLVETRVETFLDALPGMSRADLAEEVVNALTEHDETVSLLDQTIAEAVLGVQQALSRTVGLRSAAEPVDSTLDGVLAETKRRLEQVDSILEDVSEALRLAGKSEGTTGARVTAADAKFEVAKKHLDEIIETIEENPQVEDARQLLLQVGQQIGLSERKRIAEMRRHLSELRVLKTRLEQRQESYLGRVLLHALARLDAEAFREAAKTHKEIDLLTPKALQCLERRMNSFWPDSDPLSKILSAKLGDDAPFVGCDDDGQPEVGDIEAREDLMMVLHEVAVILFVENPRDLQTQINAAREIHRHSIRLSRIHAQERLDLVHQIIEGLAIYEAGGIKPSEVAQLFLLASQVAATGYIGTQL